MASSVITNRWIFNDNWEQISPSKRHNIGINQEMHLRQKGTNFIKEVSDVLKLRTLTVNTAIVYFHRFFALRSLKLFDVCQIGICSLFLSAKFEEQPIIKEDIVKVALICRLKSKHIDKEQFKRESDQLIQNENEMLLTFGFDLMVTHSHHVIGNASRNNTVINSCLYAMAYKIAGDLLRLTTLCLHYTPSFAACVAIYLSSHFQNVPITTNGSNWCLTIDPNLTEEMVAQVANKYMKLINRSKYMTQPTTASITVNGSLKRKLTANPNAANGLAKHKPIVELTAVSGQQRSKQQTYSSKGNNDQNKVIQSSKDNTNGRNTNTRTNGLSLMRKINRLTDGNITVTIDCHQ
ncbi:cyclin-T1-like isoform X2 [Oppia nitens]|uniref:cyclin-T1-like isoform X2 n=1 Tax=Oppia nitens TaxID=1686743 RepID=UPI0023DAC0D6|nr:cyclin-T1-like isoform X2 [Oppia nitens]